METNARLSLVRQSSGSAKLPLVLMHHQLETHKWAYGKTLDLRWGEDKLVPCSHKWVITFQTHN
jgi:hypothetical protein